MIKGKTAVITGISKGIGAALAAGLAEKGVQVFGWGQNPYSEENELIQFIPCDVSDENQVEAALKATLKQVDQIDFLINNAGLGIFHPIKDFPTEAWRKMMSINVDGTFFCSRAIAPLMQENGSGHIVNISSIAGRVGMAQGEGYNSSKFAVTGFSECLFNELRKDGVKVTTVYPGSTKTHFFDEIPGFDPHDYMLNPKDLADTVVHLLNTPPNYLVREIEIRPLNSKPPKK